MATEAELLQGVRQIITIPNAPYWTRLRALHKLLGTEPPPRRDLSDDLASRLAGLLVWQVVTECRGGNDDE